jgi:hypothetical protein
MTVALDGDRRVRCTRVLGGLSINVFPMGNPYDENEELVVGDGIDDSKSADPNAVPVVFPRELLAPRRPRLAGQAEDSRHDTLPVSLLVNGLDLFGRGRLDENPITCHAA